MGLGHGIRTAAILIGLDFGLRCKKSVVGRMMHLSASSLRSSTTSSVMTVPSRSWDMYGFSRFSPIKSQSLTIICAL